MGAEVVAEENERRQLVPMVAQAEAILGEEVKDVIARPQQRGARVPSRAV